MGRTATSSKSRKKAAATTQAPSLAGIQDAFQRAVIDGDDAILGLIPPNSRTGSAVLLGVYRSAYVGRLADIVASDYEQLHAYMGDAQFAEMARAYVKACPSQTPNARWFSHRLPEFLSDREPYRGLAELADLARLERALGDAFDAADDDVASLDELKQVPPEQWASLTFEAHASVRRLDLATNAFALWSALKDGSTPPAAERLAEPQRLIVWREETTSKVRVLGPEERMLWDEAMKGATFGALCELAAVFDDPDGAALRVAQVLMGWLTSGMLERA